MRRAVLTVLAAVGVAAALSVTASSTAQQAHATGMVGLPVAGLVVLLEVVNVVGAWAAITDTRTHVRVEALVGVAAASAVTAICGALTYHALGVVAPVGLLMAVHGVSRMWTTPKAAAPEQPRASAPSAPREAPAAPLVAPSPPTQPIPVCLAPPPPPQPPETPTVEQPAPPTEEGGESAPSPTDEEIAEWIAAQATRPGRDAVKREWGVGTKRAERLIREAEETPRLTIAGAAR